jgi:signal transduction histidine kinase
MNRRILLQVTAPAILIGLLLFGTCLVAVWYINRSQANLANIVSQNVRSLKAAEELEIRVRQLRHYNFLYLMDPQPQRLEPVELAHKHFEEALQVVQEVAYTPEEKGLVRRIQQGYKQYHDELAQLRSAMARPGARPDLRKVADAHPISHVVEPCEALLRLNQVTIAASYQRGAILARQTQWLMVLLGLAGPASGLIMGFGIARGLSRSIYRLSVRVQDMAHRLDQDVGQVSIAADGDIKTLDRQLSHVVQRVEEVAERLQRHQREMLRAEQLSAVGQLAASVAHEVRNPLTGVKMLVEVALRTPNPKPLTPDDLQVIHGEIVRLERTVQSLLDFARPPTPQRRECDLREVVSQATELVQARARQQRLTIAVQAPAAPVAVEIDRDQFRTVLVNLFLNALDAMPTGGRLEVNLEATPAAGIRLQVVDAGPGIAPDIAERLFTPFASTKPTGTGLGLSISRRIIEEHGGTIRAENRPAGGACFTITLPADPGLKSARRSHAIPAAAPLLNLAAPKGR